MTGRVPNALAGRADAVARRRGAAPAAAARRLCGFAARHLRSQRRRAAGPAPLRSAVAHRRADWPTIDLDSDRILVRTGPQQLATLAGAQWPDRLPAILQARLTQSFQNAGLLRVVRRRPAAASGTSCSSTFATSSWSSPARASRSISPPRSFRVRRRRRGANLHRRRAGRFDRAGRCFGGDESARCPR